MNELNIACKRLAFALSNKQKQASVEEKWKTLYLKGSVQTRNKKRVEIKGGQK